jgi:hypothetical protein
VSVSHTFPIVTGAELPRLLAIMLGRLRMGVPDCIETFEKYVGDVFGKSRNLLWPFITSKYGGRTLLKAINEVVKDYQPESDDQAYRHNIFATLGDSCQT